MIHGLSVSYVLTARSAAGPCRTGFAQFATGALQGLPPVSRCFSGLTSTDGRNPHAAPRLPSLALPPVGASLLAIFSAPRRRGSPASWLLQKRDVVRVRAVRYRFGAGLPPVARYFSGLTATDCRRRIRAAPAVPLRTSNAYAAILRALPAPRAICVVAGDGTAIPYTFFVTLHCAVLARCGCRVNSSFQTSPT